MQKDTLDDTNLLGFLSHVNDTAIRILTIIVSSNLSPPLVVIILILLLVKVLIEHLDRTATHCNGNDANLLVGQFFYHRTTEIVRRSKFTHRANNRTLGRIPITQCTLGTGEITRCQHLETWIDSYILLFPLGITLHV